MKLINSFFLMVLFASAVIITGCSDTPTTGPVDNNPTTLSKLTIPAGATIDLATLNVYVEDPSNNDVTVHKVNVAWTEAETWTTFFANTDPEFDPASLGGFNATAGLKTVDITALVRSWVDGTITNYGVILNQPLEALTGIAVLRTSEYIGTNQPYLEVKYTPAGGGAQVTVTEPAFIDTYISSLDPTTPFGNDEYMRVAHFSSYRKYSLIQFDIEEVEMNCETAYAFGTTPFCGLPDISNWGWTRQITAPITINNIPIWAGAAQCNTSNGTQVGTLSISYDGTNVTVNNVVMNSNITIENVQIWVGSTQLPMKKGKLSSAPGQFTYVNPTLPLTAPATAPFYIAIHFDVCWPVTQ